MGRVILVGASTVMAFVVLGCGGSTSGNGTTGTGGSIGSGGSGTGGVLETGGSAATGGSSGMSTGGTGGATSPGKASIEFTVAGGPYCMTAPECNVGPSIGISDSSGKALTVTIGCGDVTCGVCDSSACPGIYCPPFGITVTGAKMEWDGTSYVTRTCGTGTSCVEPVFVPPGRYTATFCATPGTLKGPDGGIHEQQCVTTSPAKCGSVVFDYPSSTVVKGTLGQATGGSSGTGGEMSDAQVSCSLESGCPNDMVCGFAIAQGCSALGTCLVRPTPSLCNAIVQLAACGCDGGTIDWAGGCAPSLPNGFAPTPVVHNGACP